jgi:hypothetical protein
VSGILPLLLLLYIDIYVYIHIYIYIYIYTYTRYTENCSILVHTVVSGILPLLLLFRIDSHQQSPIVSTQGQQQLLSITAARTADPQVAAGRSAAYELDAQLLFTGSLQEK